MSPGRSRDIKRKLKHNWLIFHYVAVQREHLGLRSKG